MFRVSVHVKAEFLTFLATLGLALLVLTALPSTTDAQIAQKTAKTAPSSQAQITPQNLDTDDPTATNSPIVFLGGEGYAPYGFLENGKPVGANVDLLKALGRVLGRPVDVRLYKWADAQVRIKRGEGHALAIGVLDAERRKLFDFTQSTFTFEFVLFANTQRLGAFENLDLSNKRIAVTRGSFPQTILENNFPEAEMVLVDHMADGFRLLSTGEVDAAIEERLVGNDTLKRNNFQGIRALEKPLAMRSAHIPVFKGNPALLHELNQAISKLKLTGEINKISRRWMGGPEYFITRSQRNAALVGAAVTVAVIGLLALFLFLNVSKRNIERKRAEEEIRTLNKELEQRVERRTKELRESEESLAMVLEGSEQGIWDWNIETGIVQRNDRWAEMLGYSSIKDFEANTDTWTDSIHPDDRDAAWASIDNHLEGRSPFHQLEYRMLTKSGGVKWIRDQAKIVQRDTRGRPLRMCGTHTDITERKALEEKLRQSQKMEAIGQLVGGIAHDYNNMLGVIIGNIQMVEKAAELDDKSRQRLDKALAAAQRNADLTAKLLGFSRAHPTGTRLTAANDCIAKLEDIIAKSLTASIEVKTHLSKDLWLVDIDPAELEDTILNLAINARDAMPNGGILVVDTANKVLDEGYVSYNPESHVGDYVVISISDTGTGMSKKIGEKIFDPFFSTKETGKGTGLGLSMVYVFVQRSGGFIKVYSEPGEGTTFRIFLPRATDRAESSSMPDNIADREPARGSETILVVDDEEFLVDLAVTQLEALGYRTLSADNGEKALEILKADPDIDLLFTDIIMPGKLDGYDLALAARQVHPALKILLTSGFAKQREKFKNGDNETLTRLAANLLSKPYMLTELATAVRRSLDKND